MIETWVIAFIYAIKKKYNIKLIFKDWPIHLPLMMLCLYIVCEILIFNDNYSIVQYGTQIKQITLLSYSGLIIKYKLFDSQNENQKNELIRFLTSPFMIAMMCLIIGYGFNGIAIAANNGHMPVYPSNTYFTGYTDVNSFTKDSFYILGDQNSKVIPLCDSIDIYISNLSIGDVLVRIFVGILLFFSIKRSNKIIK